MAPDGCTEAAMKANSFGIGLLATLVRRAWLSCHQRIPSPSCADRHEPHHKESDLGRLL
jgi:hypothetical protein